MSGPVNVTEGGFTAFYEKWLRELKYDSKATLSQLTTTFAYEPIDKLSDEIERLTISTEALTQPVEYLKKRLKAKVDTKEALNDSLNERFTKYLNVDKLSAKRAKALALIDTDAIYQTQQLVNEIKYPSDLAILSESRLAHKTRRSGDGVRNSTADDDMAIDA